LKNFLKFFPKDDINKDNSINKKNVYLINLIILLPFLAIFNIKILLASIPFFLIGYFDDIKNLSIRNRFFISFIFLFFIFYFDSNFLIKFIIFDKQIVYLNYFFSFFLSSILILGFIHVMNMSDGRNSNYGLYMLILFITIFTNTYFLDYKIDLKILLACFGILIVCILNFRDFSYFGNNGVYALSVFSGILMFDLYGENYLSTKNILAIFSIPFIDSLYVSVRRVSKKLSPFKSDLSHLHHLPKKWHLAIIIQTIAVSLLVYLSYMIGLAYLILLSIILYAFLRFIFKIL